MTASWRHQASSVRPTSKRLAVSAYLVGRNAESDDAWGLAHRRHLDEGDCGGCDPLRVLARVPTGQRLRAAGGQRVDRAARTARAAAPDDSVAHGRLDYLTGLRAAFEGDLGAAASDLERPLRPRPAMATRSWPRWPGCPWVASGSSWVRSRPGVRLLDDAMLVVGSEPISPIAVGDSYCTAIDACHDLFDVRRGQAWTDELTRWCAQQPDLVPFAGMCQVHRAEFLQLKGAWVEAMAQAGLARERLDRPFRQLAYGAAVYQQGELHRLLGEFDKAEACYRGASAAGRDPQPGLALLRLRQGRTGDAAQAIDRALSEADDPVSRSQLLAAYVEIMLASDRVAEARAAASELAEVATVARVPDARRRGPPRCRLGQAGRGRRARRAGRPAQGERRLPRARGAVRGRPHRTADRHGACGAG